jgi:hypothetical protein
MDRLLGVHDDDRGVESCVGGVASGDECVDVRRLVVVGLHGTAPWLRRLSGSEMYQPAGEVDGDEHDR